MTPSCLVTMLHGVHRVGEAQEIQQPIKWLSEMFDAYVPDTIFEMKKNYSHITPLATMNHITRCAVRMIHRAVGSDGLMC